MKKRSSHLKKLLLFGLTIISTIFVLVANLTVTHSSLSTNLIICAAASLQPAMAEIKTIYERQNPNTTLSYNFGASGLLQQQIKRGVSTDLFFSASSQDMDRLEDDNLIITNSRHNILQNKIVLVTANKNKNIGSISDLTTNKIHRAIVGDSDIVPVGRYTKEVLENYQIWDEIPEKLVFARDEQAVLTYVELGYGEVGFVYQSSAKTNDRVKIISTIPTQTHQPIDYPIAIIKKSSQIEDAEKFINFLMGDLAARIFDKYHFENRSKFR